MKTIYIVLILLFFIGLGALMLSLEYIFPPKSVSECQKIGSIGSYRKECIITVAAIKNNKNICNYLVNRGWLFLTEDNLHGEKKECKKNVIAEEYVGLRNGVYSSYNYYYNGSLESCASNGINETTNYFYLRNHTYLMGWRVEMTYYSYSFMDSCKEDLKKLNNSFCDKLKYYNKPQCLDNIGLAKGGNVIEACNGTSSISCYDTYAIMYSDINACRSDKCYRTFAIKNNDHTLCEKTNGDVKCWLYFAIKEKKIEYCDRIVSKDDADHY
jgi:hypothetical protein